MANICETRISVVGLEESPETFVKALSKAMFDIDLDNMDLKQWGCAQDENGRFFDVEYAKDSDLTVEAKKDCEGKFQEVITKRDPSDDLASGIKVLKEIFPNTWYQELVKKFDLRRGSYGKLCVLYMLEPFVKCGVSAPRFYVETKSETPYDQLKKASKAFPDLLFHAEWWIEPDGPTGEYVLRGGRLREDTRSGASWYLFDKIEFPSMSLLPKYMDLTLAQRGAAAVDDAIELIKRLHFVVHHPGFTDSRYSPFRDQEKTEQTQATLDALLAHMEEAAKTLTFEGVLLPNMTEAEAPSYPPVTATTKAFMATVEDVPPVEEGNFIDKSVLCQFGGGEGDECLAMGVYPCNPGCGTEEILVCESHLLQVHADNQIVKQIVGEMEAEKKL